MLFNAFVLALREIRRNVLRSSLTALGIIIGVASVIIMVTLGNGATAQVRADIASMGSNLLTVMPGQRVGPGGASSSAKPFRRQDVDALTREVDSVTSIAPVATTNLSVISGAKNRSTNVTGTTNAYFESGGWKLASGRWFSESELRSGAAVCIVGQTTKNELIGSADPIGSRLRLRSLSCSVIGLLQSKGKSNFGQDRDDTVVIPLRTMQRRLSGSEDIQQVQLSVSNTVSTEKAQQDITRLMRERRRLARDADDDFNIMDQQEIANTISGTTRTLTALLAAVAAISLLVGGIGIMNIMLASVMERTREIGVRRAIGATRRDVVRQFLIETTLITVTGGFAGTIVGIALSQLVAYFAGWSTIVTATSVLVASLVSVSVGIVFGLYPAVRAARLDPVYALHYE
jgi:putative ABC transport system permease protein